MVDLCNNDIERQISSVYFEEGVWKSQNKEYDWELVGKDRYGMSP